MTNLNDVEQVGPLSAYPIDMQCEARFPVAYSHGGFAQLRPVAIIPELNPLAPIQVPASINTGMTEAFECFRAAYLRS